MSSWRYELGEKVKIQRCGDKESHWHLKKMWLYGMKLPGWRCIHYSKIPLSWKMVCWHWMPEPWKLLAFCVVVSGHKNMTVELLKDGLQLPLNLRKIKPTAVLPNDFNTFWKCQTGECSNSMNVKLRLPARTLGRGECLWMECTELPLNSRGIWYSFVCQ